MGPEDRLDSWKEIAGYVKRDVRTCMKWSKHHGLPVHRINKLSMRSRVFAYKSELEDWFRQKAK